MPRLIDRELSERMELLREIASLGRSARMNAKLKVRQPLALVEVILASDRQQPWLEAHHELLREELNVKEIAYTTEGEKYISYIVQPNFKRLGPRVGRLMPAVKQALLATPRRIAAGPTARRRPGDAGTRRGNAHARSAKILKCGCRPKKAGPPRKAPMSSSCCRPT